MIGDVGGHEAYIDFTSTFVANDYIKSFGTDPLFPVSFFIIHALVITVSEIEKDEDTWIKRVSALKWTASCQEDARLPSCLLSTRALQELEENGPNLSVKSLISQ